jgi:hypothetical protein
MKGSREHKDKADVGKQKRTSLNLERSLLARLSRLGGQQLRLDGREDSSLRDDDVSKELVELLVVSDGELQVSGDDSRLLVVSGGVTGELEDLGREVCRGEERGGDEVSNSAEKTGPERRGEGGETHTLGQQRGRRALRLPHAGRSCPS